MNWFVRKRRTGKCLIVSPLQRNRSVMTQESLTKAVAGSSATIRSLSLSLSLINSILSRLTSWQFEAYCSYLEPYEFDAYSWKRHWNLTKLMNSARRNFETQCKVSTVVENVLHRGEYFPKQNWSVLLKMYFHLGEKFSCFHFHCGKNIPLFCEVSGWIYQFCRKCVLVYVKSCIYIFDICVPLFKKTFILATKSTPYLYFRLYSRMFHI